MTGLAAGKSDLGVRTASAIAMIAVAGSALWLGGWYFVAFAGLIGLGVFIEWTVLTRAFATSWPALVLWELAGICYIGTAVFALAYINSDSEAGFEGLIVWIGMVIATDIGAYFAGRTIGGPKIAPRISPSKTWAGLLGGICGASIIAAIPLYLHWRGSGASSPEFDWPKAIAIGTVVAIVAQAGDFFESSMKRRAGTKDSGNILPGHGGLFDRLDGLLAVMFLGGLLSLWEIYLRLP